MSWRDNELFDTPSNVQPIMFVTGGDDLVQTETSPIPCLGKLTLYRVIRNIAMSASSASFPTFMWGR